ncbi:MAG: hypothetical protein QNJ88_02430 [Acidimicrobiia bacterium]|nr:hypothetical protein [Acidimicrobiia bacterium]
MDLDAFIATHGPRTVVEAIEWLEANGFHRTRAIGGADTSFGNVSVTYVRDATTVLMVRDRGQWSCDLRFDDIDQPFDLGLIAAARRGDVSWTYRPHVEGEPMAILLTGDIDWPAELDAGLAWVAADRSAPGALIAERERRSEQLRARFPWAP